MTDLTKDDLDLIRHQARHGALDEHSGLVGDMVDHIAEADAAARAVVAVDDDEGLWSGHEYVGGYSGYDELVCSDELKAALVALRRTLLPESKP